MRSFIVVTEDGKRHAVIDSNIKSVEHVPGTPGTSERATHQDARAEERENLSQRQALEANNERQPAEEQRRRDEDASMAREAEDKARFGAPAAAAHQANPNQQ